MSESPEPVEGRGAAGKLRCMSAIDVPRSFSGSAQLAGKVLDGLLGGLPAGEPVPRLLVALPPEPGLPALLAPAFAHAGAPPSCFLYDDWAVYRADRAASPAGDGGPLLHFGAELAPPLPVCGFAVLFLPKGTESIERTLSRVAQLVEAGGRVLVVGAKKSAIASSRPAAERRVGPLLATRAARHAKLFAYRRAAEVPPAEDHERRYAEEIWGNRVEVVSLPGVFSHGRLDDGSRFLVEHWQPPELGRALDLGCGSGVLAAALRLARPAARVDAADARAEALEATRRTLAANHLTADGERGAVVASDVFSDLPGAWDLVLSNPPFHRGPGGHGADFGVTERLIREAGTHLAPGGRLVLVTNTFIDYPAPLRAAFGDVAVVHQTGRYRITEARRPR
jgi:16S rRNA (guanine1207-N2)-methyltransferase